MCVKTFALRPTKKAFSQLYEFPFFNLSSALNVRWLGKGNNMKTRKPNTASKTALLAAIVSRRKKAGTSVNQASQSATISQATWCRVESGIIDPTFETCFDMAQAVGIDVAIKF